MRRLIIVLALFASCSACALWTVKTSPPAGERGWLTVCWMDPDDGIQEASFMRMMCPSGSPNVEVKWPRLPIRIALTESAEPYRSDIAEAVAYWNDSVGFELFVITKMAWEDVTFLVELRSPIGLRAGTRFVREAGVLSSAVYIYAMEALPSMIGTSETIAHELGHVLGLEHDEYAESLMFGQYTNDRTRRLSAHDREIVKARYGVLRYGMILVILALILVPAIAFAAAPSATDSLDGWLQTILEATAASNWKAVVALALMGAVVGVRALAEWRKWDFVQSGFGAVVTAILLGVATTVSSAALAGTLVGVGALVSAILEGIMIATSASGAFSWWKTYKTTKQDV